VSAGKPVSKVLDALDAAISAIGEPEAEIFGHHWTPDKGLVSNDKPLKYKVIRHFGHLGHRQRDSLNSKHAHKRKRAFFRARMPTRARSYIFGVQNVQGVQSCAQQGSNVGHLPGPGVQWCPKRTPEVTNNAEFNNPDAMLPVDLMLDFEERAAIAEFDGGLDRTAAERLAWSEVIGEGEP
jgi:hypothetical protein